VAGIRRELAAKILRFVPLEADANRKDDGWHPVYVTHSSPGLPLISAPFVMALIIPSEIMSPETTNRGGTTPIRGGLSARKQKLVVAYIEQHLAEEISLLALARLAKLSPYHFARAFRHSFGIPPHRYHMVRRMNQARDLLLQSALPVTQIGARIGFRETSSFTRAYRKYAGVTPSEYRRDRKIACRCRPN
jgi:AraC family transcriptional regulator